MMSAPPTAPACGSELHAAILDHISIPVMVVERDASVLYANAAARALLGNGGLVNAIRNILSTPGNDDDSQLKKAIVDTCAHQAGHTILMGRNQVQPVVAVTLPFHGKKSSDPSCALVLLRSRVGLSSILVNSLRQLFGLSSAEAAVAVTLSMGADLHEVARQRGVTLNTLRSQLASIMGRTGTRRQAELVALISQIDSFLQLTGGPHAIEPGSAMS